MLNEFTSFGNTGCAAGGCAIAINNGASIVVTQI
jgi:hypothetical protein